MSLGANVCTDGETARSDASRLCAFEPAGGHADKNHGVHRAAGSAAVIAQGVTEGGLGISHAAGAVVVMVCGNFQEGGAVYLDGFD
jgi:hypothetical protein